MNDRHDPASPREDSEALPSPAAEQPTEPPRPAQCDTFPDGIDDDPDPVSDIPY